MTSPSDVTVESITDALDEERPAPEGFVIDTEEKAAWAVDKIVSLRAAAERLVAQFERNSTRLERELARLEEFFVPMLKAFYDAHPPSKGKTLHLATGDLAKKKEAARFSVEDEKAVVEWARKALPADLALLVAERLEAGREAFEIAEAKKLARDHHKKTKEIVPGTAITPESESFHVKSPKDG
jgi:hypothetical protein